MSDSVGSRDIIERLEATVVRADTVTGEKWSGDMVRWSDAEAAVQAAADTRTREDEQTMYAGRICADALMGKIAAQDVLIAAIERCRRFPVSDCDATSTNEAAGETPTSATPDR